MESATREPQTEVPHAADSTAALQARLEQLEQEIKVLKGETPSTGVTASEGQPQKVFGWKNVESEGGVEISLFGMLIVFIGLVLTFYYIALIPKIVGKLDKPKPKAAYGAPSPTPAATTSLDSLSPELQAAIAYVLASEQEYEQLTDYTKLTIRRDESQHAWAVAGKMRSLATRKIK
jgi:Na+-transporting methylmalonyl-CoA/oxaloacetate decarboxylase gamma subunit